MSASPSLSRPDSQALAALRERIRHLERCGAKTDLAPESLAIGTPAVDGALPGGGLPRAALHEILGDDGGATGFAAWLAARLACDGRAILWCRRGGDLYGPGIRALGLEPERLILVRGGSDTDVLWAMEEGLRSGCLAAVLGEAEAASPTAARRLQLAAESGGVTGFLLRSGRGAGAACPAVTRWQVAAVASGIGRDGRPRPRWRLDLLRCRNGTPGSWIVERTNDAASHLVVVADLLDRPAAPAAGMVTRPRFRLAR